MPGLWNELPEPPAPQETRLLPIPSISERRPSTEDLSFAPTNNIASRREVLLAVPFDDRYRAAAGEDREWWPLAMCSGPNQRRLSSTVPGDAPEFPAPAGAVRSRRLLVPRDNCFRRLSSPWILRSPTETGLPSRSACGAARYGGAGSDRRWFLARAGCCTPPLGPMAAPMTVQQVRC